MEEYVSVVGDSFSNSDDSLKVMLRIRPPLDHENDDINYFKVVSGQQLNVKVPRSSWTFKNMKRLNNETSFTFEFSYIYDWLASQEKVFSGLIDSIVLDFLSGRNGLLFTYGITNSGKTHTLIGKPEDIGILPRTIEYVFQCLEKYSVGKKPLFRYSPYEGIVESDEKIVESEIEIKKYLLEKYLFQIKNSKHIRTSHDISRVLSISEDGFDSEKIRNPRISDQVNLGIDVMDVPDSINTVHYIYMSIAEIYKEQIFDLLDSPSLERGIEFQRQALKIQGDPKKGFFVKNLRTVLICDPSEALKLLEIGLSNRRMAATRMNVNSSRSHVIYTIRIVKTTELPNTMVATKSSEICFVDLAGAERQSTTMSEGVRLKEASSINKSLLFLNRCIQEMREYRVNVNKNFVVPYRESKLTQLLHSFFIGRARMVLLVNISPSVNWFDDTFSVLKFSSLTKEALSRPVGVDLHQAVKTDVVLNDLASANLSEMSKSDLIDIIHTLRRKVLDGDRNIDSYDFVVREEMSQFTMDMINEIEEEKEKQILMQKKLVAESYLVKIEILKDEIAQLHSRLDYTNVHFETQLSEENEKLRTELALKDERFQQLMIDVETYKIDGRNEINVLEKEKKKYEQFISENNREIEKLNLIIENYKNEISGLNNQISGLNIDSEKDHQHYIELTALRKAFNKLNNQNLFYIDQFNQIPIICGNRIQGLKLNITTTKSAIDSFKQKILDALNTIKASTILLADKYRHKINCEEDVQKLSTEYSNFKESINLSTSKIISRCNTILPHLHDIKKNLHSNCDQISRSIEAIHSKVLVLSKTISSNKNTLKALKNENSISVNLLNLKQSECSNLKSEFDKLKNKYQILSDNSNSLIQSKDDYIKTIEEMRLQISGHTDQLNSIKSQNRPIQNSDSKIFDLESEIKSYKKLNEEYRINIQKLENLITERHLLGSSSVSNRIGTKRTTTASNPNKENYHGLFSKKSNIK